MGTNNGGDKGEKYEMQVAVDLINNDCRVSFPHGHIRQYDLIADKDGELIPIQVKPAKTRDANQYFIKLKDASKYDPEFVDLFAAYPVDEPHAFYVLIQR